MTDANGSHVTWRELNLLRESIESHFASLEADVQEIKWSMNVVLENKRARLRAYLPPLMAALLTLAISLPVALLTH